MVQTARHGAAEGKRAAPPLPEPGEVIDGRFVVEGLAGTGGMGAVFRARDQRDASTVAIKVIAQLRSQGDERFAREVRLLAQLSHPAIVRYVGSGHTAAGALYLAMEWLEGEDLGRTLARSQLTPAQSIALTRRVCQGAAEAHARGVVHRDIKPSNLFVVGGDASAVKLLDFGVARQRSQTHTLTRAGTVLGTVGYMAPEQAMGLPDIDAAADVFSIGCVLFECLTGRPAFQGLHDVAVLAKVLREEPPRVSELRPELGTALDQLVTRMLAKDRSARASGVNEVLAALDGLEARLSAPSYARLPVVRHLTTSERRIVSIILARTHEAAATLTSDEAQHEVDELAALAQRFEAEPLPLRGGGLLLSLSGRGAANDQACRAALCALALRRLRPELSVAVATGCMETEGVLPVGDVIDRAALLLDAPAPPFAVPIDDLTQGLLDGRFDVQRASAGPLLLGELGDVEVPRLLMGRSTPCVGREKELALLDATFDECAADSVARVVLVSAQPGIGKSRLGRAFLERVRSKDRARILIARGDQMGAGSALLLASRLVRSAAGLGADAQPEHGKRLRAYLAGLMVGDPLEAAHEFLAELTGVNTGRAASPLLRAARNDPEVMREQIRRAFEGWLTAELARGPLMMLIEDLHWGDAPSVGYVERALRALDGRPLFVLALGRPEIRELFPKLYELEGAQEVRLAGLTRRAAERLVRAVLPDDDALVGRIVSRADGNAFYLEELIRCVAEGGQQLPDTVLAMAQSRLEGLEIGARRLLRAASVYGSTCWGGGITALLGEHFPVADWLATLADRELLVRRRDPQFAGEHEYEFRHALLRDAAYAMLTDEDRCTAHRIAGHWLERAGERDPRLLASHFERGGAGERAVYFLVRASVAALESGDLDGALELAQRALRFSPQGEERGTLLLVQGYVATYRTRPDAASLDEALTLLPQSSPFWWLTVSTLIFGSVSLGRRDQAFRYLQLAIATPPGAELTGSYGAALQTMAAGMVIIGQTELAWSVLDRYEHVTLAMSNSDPLFLAWLDLARCQLATASPCQGKWQLERALAWGRAASEAMEALGSSHGKANASFYLGYTSRVLGQYESAEQALEQSLQQAGQMGSALIDQYAKLILVVIHTHRGTLTQAHALLSELECSEDASVVHGAQAMRAEAHYREGALERARAGALLALEGPSAPYRRVAHCTLARAQLALGQHADVLTHVDRALVDDGASTPEYQADLLASKVEALKGCGRHDEAQLALARAVALVEGVLAQIENASLRQSFMTRIEANARVLALSGRLADSPR